ALYAGSEGFGERVYYAYGYPSVRDGGVRSGSGTGEKRRQDRSAGRDCAAKEDRGSGGKGRYAGCAVYLPGRNARGGGKPFPGGCCHRRGTKRKKTSDTGAGGS